MEKVEPWRNRSWQEVVSETKSIADTITKRRELQTQPNERSIKPVFGTYVTRNHQFQEELQDLLLTLRNYAYRPKVKRPFNILLSSEPGSGKSFLLKQLSETLSNNIEVQFDEYHVPAFRSLEDLYGSFQRVQSANLRGKLPIVFFDEVDTKVEGRHLLANFLAPMWDGLFHVGKDSFALGRAIFSFAASSMLPSPRVDSSGGRIGELTYQSFVSSWKGEVQAFFENESLQKDNADNAPSLQRPALIPKCKDFVDRVDRMICIPPVNQVFLGAEFYEELIDIACLMVKKHFDQVDEIEGSAVIALVADLMESPSRRAAERCVFSSCPDGNKFGFSSLPKSEQDRFQDNSGIDLGLCRDQWITIKIETKQARRVEPEKESGK